MHLTALSESRSSLQRSRTPRRLALSLRTPAAPPQCGSFWKPAVLPAREFVSNLADKARGPNH